MSSSSRSQTSRRRRTSTTRATSSPATRTRPARATRTPLALLLAGALALAGCGGDEADEPDVAADPAATPAQSQPRDGSRPTGSGEGGVELTELASFEAPVHVTQPPGEDEDLYVVEQAGTIRRLAPGGATETFLDISGEVTAGGEQGLLSLAFAPDFERSGLLYVYFTDPAGDQRVVEYRADGGAVDEASRRDVLVMQDRYANHNGGFLLFGPDDLLYIGTGDVGGSGDPERNGLDTSSLLGKILRIDPRAAGGRPYTVPEQNPLADDAGAAPEVYAYGLRNPWRFSFDPETGSLAIGDVGQDEQEEVNLVAEGDGAGASFGWSAYEGVNRFNEDQSSPDAIEPVLVASHEDGNCSITGGLVVRDRDLESLYGRYLWGDFCVGELRSFTARPGRDASDDRTLGLEVPQLSSFGTDNAGNVYAVSLNGPVYRIDPAS